MRLSAEHNEPMVITNNLGRETNATIHQSCRFCQCSVNVVSVTSELNDTKLYWTQTGVAGNLSFWSRKNPETGNWAVLLLTLITISIYTPNRNFYFLLNIVDIRGSDIILLLYRIACAIILFLFFLLLTETLIYTYMSFIYLF